MDVPLSAMCDVPCRLFVIPHTRFRRPLQAASAAAEICHGRRYNFKTDVWSAGCVLYELTCLRRPFEGPDMRTLISKIVRGAYPPPPPRYSVDLRALIDAMLRRDPAQRLSIGAVLRRPVMQARIRKFLSESAAHGQLGATAAGALPAPAPAAAPAGGLRRPPVDLRPPLNPLGGAVLCGCCIIVLVSFGTAWCSPATVSSGTAYVR